MVDIITKSTLDMPCNSLSRSVKCFESRRGPHSFDRAAATRATVRTTPIGQMYLIQHGIEACMLGRHRLLTVLQIGLAMLVVRWVKICKGKTTARRFRFVCENRHLTPTPIQNATKSKQICNVCKQMHKLSTIDGNDTIREHKVSLRFKI